MLLNNSLCTFVIQFKKENLARIEFCAYKEKRLIALYQCLLHPKLKLTFIVSGTSFEQVNFDVNHTEEVN